MTEPPDISIQLIDKVVRCSNHPQASRDGTFKPASVIALLLPESPPELLFIQKAHDEDYAWSGQMAFPGGHSDPEDLNRLDTALRELEEELRIFKENVSVIGSIGHFSTINNREIETFIGIWHKKEIIRFDENEISRIIPIPIDFLVSLHIQKGFHQNRPNIMNLTYHFEDVVIWGVTAKMVFHLIELLLAGINKPVGV